MIPDRAAPAPARAHTEERTHGHAGTRTRGGTNTHTRTGRAQTHTRTGEEPGVTLKGGRPRRLGLHPCQAGGRQGVLPPLRVRPHIQVTVSLICRAIRTAEPIGVPAHPPTREVPLLELLGQRRRGRRTESRTCKCGPSNDRRWVRGTYLRRTRNRRNDGPCRSGTGRTRRPSRIQTRWRM